MARHNWKRFFAVSCSHGQFLHGPDWEAMLEHKQDFRPHTTVHLGDWMDTTCLRSGATDAERSTPLDWPEAKKCLEALRPNVVLFGNHEARLEHVMESSRNTIVQTYCKDGLTDIATVTRKLKAKVLPYDAERGVYQLGGRRGLRLLHGYHIGENAVKKHAQIYGDCLFGHVHRVEDAESVHVDGAHAITIGCMCDWERMGYIRRRTTFLRWERAWAFGYYNERTGGHRTWVARKVDGTWLLPNGPTGQRD